MSCLAFLTGFLCQKLYCKVSGEETEKQQEARAIQMEEVTKVRDVYERSRREEQERAQWEKTNSLKFLTYTLKLIHDITEQIRKR